MRSAPLSSASLDDVHQGDPQARLQRHLRDARAHLPCTDDDDVLVAMGSPEGAAL